MRHGLLLALIAALALCPPAWAGTVTVAPEGGEPVSFSLAELEPRWDVRDRTYTLRDSGGDTPVVVSGISIDRLLAAAGVDPFRYAGATVSAGGRTVALARDLLTDPAAFPEGRPVFHLDASGARFLRPSTGPGDFNAADHLAGDVTVELARASRLRVVATASDRRVEAGDRITFTAVVEGAAAGEQVRVRWTFDDGRSASGTRVRHRFRRPGTYQVVVGATSGADPAGASAVVTIRVGRPPPGPDREGGGTNPDAPAPDSGPATGPRGGRRSSGGDGDRAGSSAGGSRRSSRADRRGLTRSPRRERRRRTRSSRDDARQSLPAVTRPDEPRDSSAGGDLARVRGTLLGGAAPAVVPAPVAAVQAARTGDPEPDETGSVPEGVLYVLLIIGLMSLGAWWEHRATFRRARLH